MGWLSERLGEDELTVASQPNDVSNGVSMVPEEDGESPSGILGHVGDFVKGAIAGPFKEVENVIQTGYDIANFVDDKFFGDKLSNDFDVDLVPDAIKPKGGAGKTAQAISAFASGWFSFGSKIQAGVKGMKVLQAVPKAQKFISVAVAGGATDFITGDGTDERLADVLLDNEIMGNAVVEFLASDANDTAAEARLKNAAEGFIIGSALEGAMALWKGLRATRAAGAKDGIAGSVATRKVLSEKQAANEVIQAAKDKTGLTMTKEAKRAADNRAAFKAVTQSSDDVVEGASRFNLNKVSEPTKRELLRCEDDIFKAIGDEPMRMAKLGEDVMEEASRTAGDVLGTLDQMRIRASGSEEWAKDVAYVHHTYQNVIIPEVEYARAMVRDGVEGAAERLEAALTRSMEGGIYYGRVNRGAGRALKAADILRFIGDEPDEAVKAALADPLATAKNTMKSFTKEQKERLADQILTQRRIGGDTLAPILNALPDGHPMRKAIGANKESWGYRALMTYRYNSMLSSVRGRVRDAISMTTKSVVMPFEKTVSGMAEGFHEAGVVGAARGAQRGKYYTQGMFQAMDNAWEMAKIAYHNGTSVLRGGDMMKQGIDTPDVLKALQGPTAIGGKVVTTPTRIMAAMDEFFGQMHYYAETYERLMRGINETGLLAPIKDLAMRKEFVDGWIKENMDKAYREVLMKNGEIIKGGAVWQQGMKAANEATYQMALGDKGKKFAAWIDSSKALQFLFPFKKTPINLMMDGLWIRSPIGAGLHLRDAYKAGNMELVGEMWGHLATGTLLWGGAYKLYTEGMLTSSGPTNSTQRNAMYETGWQPYSLKVGDKYIPVNAFEPFSNGLMLVADLFETMDRLEGSPPDELGQAALFTLGTFAQNRTYLQGLSNIMKAMGSKDGSAQFLTQSLSSFIPAAFKNAAQAVDPVIYETRGMLDTFKAEMGMTAELTPQHNWLTGNINMYRHGGGLGVFNPVVVSTDEMDMVFDELSKSSVGKPQRRINGVELSNDEYSEYCRLHGTTQINGKNMYETLRTVVASDAYDVRRLGSADTSHYELNDNRNEALRKIVNEFRKKAQSELLQSNPRLRGEIQELKDSSTSRSRKGSSAFNFVTKF